MVYKIVAYRKSRARIPKNILLRLVADLMAGVPKLERLAFNLSRSVENQ